MFLAVAAGLSGNPGKYGIGDGLELVSTGLVVSVLVEVLKVVAVEEAKVGPTGVVEGVLLPGGDTVTVTVM